ncbi:MAG TPA: cytochrome ubiquinol oxidase subunit I, partial [Sporichthyaceae bacterium]|nr:cytochrome ubiquinol oxidase subunit I [Sporichthyaceae bacterium]
MTTADQTLRVAAVPRERKRTLGQAIIEWATTTDHKKIGHLYLMTSFIFFMLAGFMAMIMRAQLARPGNRVV